MNPSDNYWGTPSEFLDVVMNDEPSNNWSAPSEFLVVLVNDEVDSGSELEELENETLGEKQKEQVKVKIEVAENIEVKVDVTVEPLDSEPVVGNESQHKLNQTESSAHLPEELGERSPLRSPKSSSYNQLSSPNRRNYNDRSAAFYSSIGLREVKKEPESENLSYSRTASSRGQVQFRSSHPYGGNNGKRHNVAASSLSDELTWSQNEHVSEIYLKDEDIPPKLREMVHKLEDARGTHSEEQKSRDGEAKNESDDDDEYYDSESYIANELFKGDKTALDFQWSSMPSFQGVKEGFLPVHIGPRFNSSCGYEAFRQFWDDCILNHIVKETNQYATELKSSSDRFAKEWFDTNIHEIFILFAFWMMLDIIRMPSIKSCYSNNPLLKTNIFKTLMTESRYWMLNRAVHFVDNSTRTSNSPRLFCLGPVISHLNSKFMEAYIPSQNIRITESLTIKTRAAQFGIKMFELCESATGYVWSFPQLLLNTIHI